MTLNNVWLTIVCASYLAFSANSFIFVLKPVRSCIKPSTMVLRATSTPDQFKYASRKASEFTDLISVDKESPRDVLLSIFSSHVVELSQRDEKCAKELADYRAYRDHLVAPFQKRLVFTIKSTSFLLAHKFFTLIAEAFLSAFSVLLSVLFTQR